MHFPLEDFDDIVSVGTGSADHLVYTACPHLEKYEFCQNAPIKKYLETKCKGFVKDPKDRYTLNYIIAVLIVNWAHLKIIKHHAVKVNGYIRKALRYRLEFLFTSHLRPLVLQQLDAKIERKKLSVEWGELTHFYMITPYRTPLWCPPPSVLAWLRDNTPLYGDGKMGPGRWEFFRCH